MKLGIKKKGHTSHRYIIPGLVILTLAAFLFFQQFNSFKETRQAAADERQALQQTRERLEELMLLEEQSAALQNRLAVLENQLPDAPGEENLIVILNDLSRRCGVQLTQITFGEPINHQEYTELPFDLTFTGSFRNILDLTGELQHTPRLLRINELVMTKDSVSPAEVNTDISASAFYTAN